MSEYFIEEGEIDSVFLGGIECLKIFLNKSIDHFS